MYHVGLDLTPDQVKQLKVAVAKKGTTVKGFVAALVVGSLDKESESSEAGEESRE